MMRDAVRPQVDILSEGMRNDHLDHKELRRHYPMKIIWRFSAGFRYETEWFQAHDRVRQKRTRGMHSLMGPNDMSGFDRHQMCMDVKKARV